MRSVRRSLRLCELLLVVYYLSTSCSFFSWVLLMLLSNWYLIRCIDGCMLSYVEYGMNV